MAQQSGPNPIEIYEGAVQMMLPILGGVNASQLGSATPCTEWNVQQLITHNIKVAQLFHGILVGNPNVDPMDVSGELPAEGAAAAYEASANALLQAAKTRKMDEIIEAPFGSMPVGHLLRIPIADLVIHKWDLAKATSQDTSIDSNLAEVCYQALMANITNARESGFFGAEVTVAANASVQDKLLGLSGRQP